MGRLPPCSSVLAQRPRAPSQERHRGHDLGPGHWPLHLPFPPPQPEGSLVSGPALGRREKAERKKGWRWQEVQDPFLMGTSAGPTWSLPGVGAGAGQPGLGPLSCVHPHLAPGWPQPRPHSHLGGLYLFHSPSSATSLGRGWTLGLYRINTNPDGVGLFAVASDPPLLTPSLPP